MRAITTSILTAALLIALVACGGGASGDADTGGGGFDANILVPDLGGGPRGDTGRDGGPADAPRPDDGGGANGDADAPDGAVADGGRPADAPPPRDAPPADVDPCRSCPADHPACIEGRCACVENSCAAGAYCDDGACVPCAADARCGPDCRDCRPEGLTCAADGSGCVACDPLDPAPCPAGEYCAGGDCVPCDTAAACGADCAPCPAETPVCEGGACVCDDGSCPLDRYCADDGVCRLCNTALACGEGCVDCREVGTPNCVEGECRCLSDDHCASGTWCVDGACVECALDDPLHCGADCAVCEGATPVCVDGRCACTTDEDCGAAARCADGGCLACDDGAHCGAACLPCPDAAPVCHEGGCVACVTGADCGAGEWCDAGTCRRCRDDDPAHCGVACAVCEGGAPVCTGGRCVCGPGSCPDYEACVADVCVPCDGDERCGIDCAACAAPTPRCAPDGSQCVACLSDDDCGGDDVCRDDRTCGPACAAPGCANDLSPDAEECDRAQTIGRLAAIQTAFLSGDTTDDGDDDNLSTTRTACWDAKYDNFYRMYLMAGDRIDVVLDPTTASFDSMLKLYRGTDCEANGDDDLVDCYHQGGSGEDDTFAWTAPADGWVTIVVDGRSAFSDRGDWGGYNLRVTLTCATPGCCCL